MSIKPLMIHFTYDFPIHYPSSRPNVTAAHDTPTFEELLSRGLNVLPHLSLGKPRIDGDSQWRSHHEITELTMKLTFVSVVSR